MRIGITSSTWSSSGSGAGGLTAAIAAHDLGQSVAVLEKSDQYGGTSAISGGGVWVPSIIS